MSDTRTQARLRPVIRVFVSSTFSDMKHERKSLYDDVFPKLEQLCQRQGFQFQAIDLRWGISTEAGLDHRTMRICFDELRRAQDISPRPNFLILLGNRYGWRPLPEEISVEEFHTLEHAATQIPGSTDKSAVAVLRDWYLEDTNAVPPIYLLQSRHQDLGDNQDYTQNAVWNQVQAALWTIINRAMPPEQLQRRFDGTASEGSPPAIVRFQASATEQEIWRGALRVPDAREHVLAFFREIENLADFFDPKPIKDFVDVDSSGHVAVALQVEQDRLKAELRQRLGSANVFRNEALARLVEAQDYQDGRTADVTTDHLAQLCANVVRRLSEIIQGQIDEYWRNTAQAFTDRADRELEIEQREYERFAKERGGEESFVGRQLELQAILDYVGSDSSWSLVIHGASGCGKTALLARASQEVAKTRKRIERFIGVAPRSSDLRSLLSSLCQELRQRNPCPDSLPTEIKELRDEFSQHLQAATPEQPLILFLDALDQLADVDNGRVLNWLPSGSLPAHVKLVVSCLSDRATDDPVSQPYAKLQRCPIPAENFINLDVFSEAEARLLLFDRWLPNAGRKVSDEQRARIEQRLASPACRQPIFLKLLFEEVQLWHSYEPALAPGESVRALLGQLFDRLCQPTNHGLLLVNRVLGYLSASRHGLEENEILEILFADPEYRAKLNEDTEQNRHELPPNAKRIPIGLWSRLRFDLAPYLSERAAPGANVLTFYHRQVGEVARDRYLSGDEELRAQSSLATYFHEQEYFLESPEAQRARVKQLPPTPRPVNVRKVDELPWQQLKVAKLSGEWEDVETLFTDLSFLEAKVEAGLALDLARDFSDAMNALAPEYPDYQLLKLLSEALGRDIHFIDRYPTTVFQCLWNTCWWYDCAMAKQFYEISDGSNKPWKGDKARLNSLLENWKETKESQVPGFLWFRSLLPPRIPLGQGEVTTLETPVAKILHLAFDADSTRLACLTGSGIIRSWTVANWGLQLEVSVTSSQYRQWHKMEFSADGLHLLLYGDDSSCTIDLSTGIIGIENVSCRIVPRGEVPFGSSSITHTHDGYAAIFAVTSPNGQQIALAEGIPNKDNYRFVIVEAQSGTRRHILGSQATCPTSMTFSNEGTQLVTTGWDLYARLWDTATGTHVRDFEGLFSPAVTAVISPDARFVACGCQYGGIHVFRLQGTQTRRSQFVLDSEIGGVGLSSDCRLLSWNRRTDGTFDLRTWNLGNGECVEQKVCTRRPRELNIGTSYSLVRVTVGDNEGSFPVTRFNLGEECKDVSIAWINRPLKNACTSLDCQTWVGYNSDEVFAFQLEGDLFSDLRKSVLTYTSDPGVKVSARSSTSPRLLFFPKCHLELLSTVLALDFDLFVLTPQSEMTVNLDEARMLWERIRRNLITAEVICEDAVVTGTSITFSVGAKMVFISLCSSEYVLQCLINSGLKVSCFVNISGYSQDAIYHSIQEGGLFFVARVVAISTPKLEMFTDNLFLEKREPLQRWGAGYLRRGDHLYFQDFPVFASDIG